MNKSILILIIMIFVISFPISGYASIGGGKARPKDTTIIKNGASHAVIVLGQDSPSISRAAAKEMQETLKQATSATIPIVPSNRIPRKTGIIMIIIGAGPIARAHGVDEKTLPPEAFRIKITKHYIILAGHDVKLTPARTSLATQWAVDYLLGRYVGVRWLWPGKLGTYIPKQKTIDFPAMDLTKRPSLGMRIFLAQMRGNKRIQQTSLLNIDGYSKLKRELNLWETRHELGSRIRIHFGGAFSLWWSKYHASHPDYFAKPIPGMYQPYPRPSWVKLRIGNPHVTTQIIADWRAAGRPDNWNVCPNDGVGFDTSNASRKMDYPQNQSPLKIWLGKANLTARYIKFWDNLLTKMRKENPNVTLSTFAYSAYRDMLKPVAIHKGLEVEFVNGFGSNAKKQWLMWSKAGAQLYLRPNWWWVGGPAPVLPLHEAGNYFKFAVAHGMQGFWFDSLMGYWATQGPYYYLIARLSERPDLSVDDVISEYASAFSDAAPAIKQYLSYWETITERIAYPMPAGGNAMRNRSGLFYLYAKKYHKSTNSLTGSWQLIPYLYTDDVLNKAEKILDNAKKLAENDDDQVKKRIAFLYSGLEYLRAVRNIIAAQYSHVEGEESIKKEQKTLKLLQKKLTEQGVIWGDSSAAQLYRLLKIK